MKEKNITKNYIYNLAYQMLIIILPIITTPYLSRILGAEAIGVYGYTVSIVTYFTLLGALGLTVYGQREIAYVQDEKDKRSKIFSELFTFRLITVLIAIIIFYVFFCIQGENKIYYRILIIELLATSIDISWFFQGIEDFKKVVIRNFVIKAISVVLIFLFIKSPADLWKYFLIYSLSTFIGNATLWIKLKNYVHIVKIKLKDLKKHIRPAISLFIPQIASSVYTVLDKTMLGTIVEDLSEVGYYEQSQKVIKIALTVVTTMGVVMIPRIANTYAKGDKQQINKYMRKTFNFIWFLALPIMFGIIAIAKKFVPCFFGDGYDAVADLMILTSPIIIFISLSTIMGQQFLLTIKKQNIRTIAIIIGAIVNVTLNFILLKHYKAVGAVISTVVAEFLICMIEIIYVVKKKLIRLRDVFYNCIKYLIVSLIMMGVLLIIGKYMQTSVLSTMIQIFVGIVIYTVILFALKDEFFINVLNKFKKGKE